MGLLSYLVNLVSACRLGCCESMGGYHLHLSISSRSVSKSKIPNLAADLIIGFIVGYPLVLNLDNYSWVSTLGILSTRYIEVRVHFFG